MSRRPPPPPPPPMEPSPPPSDDESPPPSDSGPEDDDELPPDDDFDDDDAPPSDDDEPPPDDETFDDSDPPPSESYYSRSAYTNDDDEPPPDDDFDDEGSQTWREQGDPDDEDDEPAFDDEEEEPPSDLDNDEDEEPNFDDDPEEEGEDPPFDDEEEEMLDMDGPDDEEPFLEDEDDEPDPDDDDVDDDDDEPPPDDDVDDVDDSPPFDDEEDPEDDDEFEGDPPDDDDDDNNGSVEMDGESVDVDDEPEGPPPSPPAGEAESVAASSASRRSSASARAAAKKNKTKKENEASSNLVLPVRTASKKAPTTTTMPSEEAKAAGRPLSTKVDTSLSAGLKVKQPPKLLVKRTGTNANTATAAAAGSKGKPASSVPSGGDAHQRATLLNAEEKREAEAQTRTSAPPQSAMPPSPPPPVDEASASMMEGTADVVALSPEQVLDLAEQSLRDPEEVALEAEERGFAQTMGKFEGDDFESLFMRVDTTASMMYVMTAGGIKMEFDLSTRAFVFEDTADPTSIIFDFRKNLIVFKFPTTDALLNIMKTLPPAVFMVADLTEDEKKLLEGEDAGDAADSSGKKAKTDLKAPPQLPKSKGKYENKHTKGQSVEDLLEDDFAGPAGGGEGGKDELEIMFNAKMGVGALAAAAGASGGGVGSDGALPIGAAAACAISEASAPRRKAELLEHIRRPQYSVRRVTLLCEWINSLHIWPNPVTIPTLHREMCNGLLLARIVKTVNPSVQFLNLNERALAKKPALQNLEQALGHIWRSKSLNNSRIPSAMEIYVGNTAKTSILINELFGVYVQRPLYKNSMRILKWYHSILKQYSRPLPARTFEDGDLSGVWPHFQSGTALFCVIYHLFGPNMVGAGNTSHGGVGVIRVDPLRVAGTPSSICDYRNNLFYVFTILEALAVDVIWTPEDWISNPDTEFIMLQLSYIYEAFKHKQSALPPAQGATAGMTSGPNGEPLVVGLIFSDSRPAAARLTTVTRKAVLLGHNSDSMPLLPVDRAGKSSRFISSVCPLGMISNNAQIAQISVNLRENRVHVERVGWDQSAPTAVTRESAKNVEVIGLLREHNKRSTEDGSSTLTALAAIPTSELTPSLGPGTLASGQLIKEEYKPRETHETVDGGRIHSATLRKAANDVDVQNSVLKKGQEIETAVQNLEEEMLASQAQFNALEEELANRYLELEASAAYCDPEQYETKFDKLEQERHDLEDEKLKLQTHFSFKLASIKDIYTEAEQRVRVSQLQDQQAQRVTVKGVTRVVTGSSRPSSPTPGGGGAAGAGAVGDEGGMVINSPGSPSKRKQKTAPPAPIDVAQAEKSWVSQLKPTTHNYHLRNLQAASTAATTEVWTPNKLKAKERQREKEAQEQSAATPNSSAAAAARKFFYASSQGNAANASAVDNSNDGSVAAAKGRSDGKATHVKADHLGSTKKSKAQQQRLLSPEEQINLSWQRFKQRLHMRSTAWNNTLNNSGSVKSGSLSEILNSPPASPSVTLVSVPHKSLHPPATHLHQHHLQEIPHQHPHGHHQPHPHAPYPAGSPASDKQLQQLSETIRAEETSRMLYEDERRRLVMHNSNSANHSSSSGGGSVGSGGNNNRTPFSSTSALAPTFSHANHPLRRGSAAATRSPGAGTTARGSATIFSPGVGSTGPSAAKGISSGTYAAELAGSSLHTGGGGMDGMGLSLPSASTNSAGAGAGGGGGGRPSMAEVDAAYKWVSIPRPLTIAERNPKEYTFAVTSNEDSAASAGVGEEDRGTAARNASRSSSQQQQPQFVLEWRAGGGSGSGVHSHSSNFDHTLAGCIALSEVKSIPESKTDALEFTIFLGTSAKALKNSKGRTSVTLRCNSPGECAKYLASLRCIWRSYA